MFSKRSRLAVLLFFMLLIGLLFGRSQAQGDFQQPTLQPSPSASTSTASTGGNAVFNTIGFSTDYDFQTSLEVVTMTTVSLQPTVAPTAMKGCLSAPTLANGKLQHTPKQFYLVGDSVQYLCNAGYLPSPLTASAAGSTIIETVCIGDGNQWENISHYCQDDDECLSKPDLIRDCHRCENTDGSFQCVCNSTHILSRGGCVENCGDPGTPENGFVQSSARNEHRFALNAELKFTCKTGYDLVGEAAIDCRSLTKTFWNWSHPIPSCKEQDTGGGGLSDGEKTGIIVVCVLIGLALLVGLGIFAVVRHTKTMYKTMAKRHSQVSLQSRLDSQRAKVVVDNRRSNRRNSRSERRSIISKRSMSVASQLVPAHEGDVMFVSASSTRQDLDKDFTDHSAASLLANQEETSGYAPIGPGLSGKGPDLPARNKSKMSTASGKQDMDQARRLLRGSSSEDLLPTDDDKSSTASSSEQLRCQASLDSTDDGQTTDYEDQI